MTAAVQPFIPDHAAQFAVQLLGFLASKLTMQAYDQAVFGELLTPNSHQVHAQQSSGAPASDCALLLLTNC